MSDRIKLFWLGIFIIAALALAAWLLLFLRPSYGDGEKILRVRFTNIEKILLGTRVTLAGRPVGEVIAIKEVLDARSLPTDSNGNLYFYELLLRVDSNVKIYNCDEIVFSTAGLLGEKSIAILPRAPANCPHPEKEITNNILYAQSTDPISDAVTTLTRVSKSVEKTLNKIGCFMDNNGDLLEKR